MVTMSFMSSVSLFFNVLYSVKKKNLGIVFLFISYVCIEQYRICSVLVNTGWEYWIF